MNRLKALSLASAGVTAIVLAYLAPASAANQAQKPLVLLAANDACSGWCGDACFGWETWSSNWCNAAQTETAVAPATAVASAEQPAAEKPAPAAKPADQAAAPTAKVPSANPQTGNKDAIDTGRTIYFTWCVQCHGLKANGESRFGAYAGDLTRFWRGYKEFVQIVKNGRTGNLGMMPAWKEYMDEELIGKIGAYLETLAVEGANWQ